MTGLAVISEILIILIIAYCAYWPNIEIIIVANTFSIN